MRTGRRAAGLSVRALCISRPAFVCGAGRAAFGPAPLVGTVAFIFLCGESGILARSLQHIFHLSKAPGLCAAGVHCCCFILTRCIRFFTCLPGPDCNASMPASLRPRAVSAPHARVLFRVTLPQLTPSLIAAALLTFMTSMASFSAPLLFGGNVRVLTLEIFNARQRGDTCSIFHKSNLVPGDHIPR